jgi:hypothetical protein
LIDTPGFNDSTRSETEILKELASYLGENFKEDILLTGIIYVHALERRMMGSSLRNLKMFRELCGPEAFGNVVLVTTGWGDLVKANKYNKAVAHEDELRTDPRYFAPLIAKGATLARFEDTRESALSLIKRLVGFEEVSLKLQRELILENLPLAESSAGAVVNEELKRLDDHYKAELQNLKDEIKTAQAEHDGELEEALALTQEAFEAQIRQIHIQKDQLLYQRRNDQRKHDQDISELRKQMDEMKLSQITLHAEKIEAEKSLKEVIDMVRQNQGKLRPEEQKAVDRELESAQEDGKTQELLISLFNMVGSVAMTVLGFGEIWGDI